MVNVGSTPSAPAGPAGPGQAHRPLLLTGCGGATVVLGGRESRSDGEGSQRIRGTLGWEEVVGEHWRAAARPRWGQAAGTSYPAQAARVGIGGCRARVPRSVEPGLRPGDAVGRLVAGERQPRVTNRRDRRHDLRPRRGSHRRAAVPYGA